MEIMCSEENKCVRIWQVWMTKDGQRVEIVCIHGGHTDEPFQVRYAGRQHYWAFRFEWLDYLISKECM